MNIYPDTLVTNMRLKNLALKALNVRARAIKENGLNPNKSSMFLHCLNFPESNPCPPLCTQRCTLLITLYTGHFVHFFYQVFI